MKGRKRVVVRLRTKARSRKIDSQNLPHFFEEEAFQLDEARKATTMNACREAETPRSRSAFLASEEKNEEDASETREPSFCR